MIRFLYLAMTICICLISCSALACTGLVLADDHQVLVGNNEDWYNQRTKIWFIQPVNDRYGSIIFGFDNYYPQGGMNQKGLFFDAFALKAQEVAGQAGKPSFKGNLIKEVMATCATIEEALALFDRYDRSFMARFQLFIADATGDAAIVEGGAVIRKTGEYQLVTNFRQSKTKPENTTCKRYQIAKAMIENRENVSISTVRCILAATHQEGEYPTLYSNIYDLKAKKVHVYHFHNFQDEIVIDLERELRNRSVGYDMPALFPLNFSAQVFCDRYVKLEKTYRHEDLVFEVRYPGVYKPGETLDPDHVFLANSRFGQVPVLTISVVPVQGDMTLAQVGGEVFASRLRRLGKDVRMRSNQPQKLADATDVYESRFTWRWKERMIVNSLVLSAIREGQVVNVALHNTGELNYLRHIPYSLRFHPD